MSISAKRSAFLLCAVACVAYISLQTEAHAQAQPQKEAPERDASLEREYDTYEKYHLQDRFGLYLDTYAPVCTSPREGEPEVQCASRVVTNASGTPMAWQIFVPEGYYPHQLLKAYGLTGRSTASKPPVIAIVVAYDAPFVERDLALYSRAMGIPGLPRCYGPVASSRFPCFQKVNQEGRSYPLPRPDEAWSLEASMDVEIAHAICQNCSILLVEASSAYVSDMMAAVDKAVEMGADVVSNSYGTMEFDGMTEYDKHFMREGVAFTASSGDAGYRVEFPAASRFVTAVGGTTLILEPDGTYVREIAWSGSGSGCSAYSPREAWQTHQECGKRLVADVSAVADPNTGAAIYSSYGYGGKRGWYKLGGTSLSAPIIAGIYALSGRASESTQPATLLPYLYGNDSNLRDVVEGSNGECGGSLLCTAVAGYDGPTGLGTPKGIGAF